ALCFLLCSRRRVWSPPRCMARGGEPILLLLLLGDLTNARGLALLRQTGFLPLSPCRLVGLESSLFGALLVLLALRLLSLLLQLLLALAPGALRFFLALRLL